MKQQFQPRDLCAAVGVITPNLAELAVLCERPVRSSFDAACADAQYFAQQHGNTVIVKGGHLSGSEANNAVVTPDSITAIVNPRVDTKNSHGTGCSLSSALATRLGAGESVITALRWSTEWINGALRHADELSVGKGNGPVHHFWKMTYS